MGEKVVKTLEVLKLRNAVLNTGNSVAIEVVAR